METLAKFMFRSVASGIFDLEFFDTLGIQYLDLTILKLNIGASMILRILKILEIAIYFIAKTLEMQAAGGQTAGGRGFVLLPCFFRSPVLENFGTFPI